MSLLKILKSQIRSWLFVPHVVNDGDHIRVCSNKPAEKVKTKRIFEKAKELFYVKKVLD
jgi:hypothetical protein